MKKSFSSMPMIRSAVVTASADLGTRLEGWPLSSMMSTGTPSPRGVNEPTCRFPATLPPAKQTEV